MTYQNKMKGVFTDKPITEAYFEAIDTLLTSLGGAEKEVKAQFTYKLKRKFLWLWVYDKTADGTLFANVLLDHQMEAPFLHDINQVSKNRFNHNIVIKSMDTIQSQAFQDLLQASYSFAKK
ncbi:DUF5655 domain-containing protein [Aerococcaceae bacterium 50-4]